MFYTGSNSEIFPERGKPKKTYQIEKDKNYNNEITATGHERGKVITHFFSSGKLTRTKT